MSKRKGGYGALPRLIATDSDGEERALLGSSGQDTEIKPRAPKDKWMGVYWILLIHGVGTLMPWNMFITANSYFVDYKLGGKDTEYGRNFLSYMGICAQVPNLVLQFINLFVKIQGSLTLRIVTCILIACGIFILTTALAMVDSSAWPFYFFLLTMASVVVLNSANGIYQNSVFGLAADFPPQYSNTVVLGNNISGTFVAVLSMVTKATSPDLKMAAVWYFITALFILLICLDTYFVLPFLRFYRHYHAEGNRKREAEAAAAPAFRRGTGCAAALRPYFEVAADIWPMLWNVFFVFFVSLTIFPAMQTDVRPVDPDSFPIPPNWFTDVTCFLCFNLFAMLGNILANFVQVPGPRFLWIPVLLRGLLLPYFAACNYRPETRTFPVWIYSDWAYVVAAVLMSFTSGYFSSLCMMYAPRLVSGEKARVAGMMAGFFLILGIVAGVNFTLVVAWITESLGPVAPLGTPAPAILNATASALR